MFAQSLSFPYTLRNEVSTFTMSHFKNMLHLWCGRKVSRKSKNFTCIRLKWYLHEQCKKQFTSLVEKKSSIISNVLPYFLLSLQKLYFFFTGCIYLLINYHTLHMCSHVCMKKTITINISRFKPNLYYIIYLFIVHFYEKF